MDLAKIGKFIQQCRKEKGLTQLQLAEKIFVSEKTISKWECGKGFPDTALMLPLCEVLEISANELLAGKLLSGEREYKESAEQNLIALAKQQEYNAKKLFTAEFLLIWFTLVVLCACTIIPACVDIPVVWKVLIVVFGVINAFVACAFCFVIETKVGYYECGKCHNKYVPSYKQTIFAMHFGTTRYMKCPKCHKRSWHKKKFNLD